MKLEVWAPVASATFAGIALLFDALAHRTATKQANVNLFLDYFRMLKETVEELDGKAWSTRTGDEKAKWALDFGEVLEAFSFVLNAGYLRDSRVVGFWSRSLLSWRENVLKLYYPQYNDPKVLGEYKKLCQAIELAEAARKTGFGRFSDYIRRKRFFLFLLASLAVACFLEWYTVLAPLTQQSHGH